MDFSTLNKERFQGDSLIIHVKKGQFAISEIKPVLIQNLSAGVVHIEVISQSKEKLGQLDFKYLPQKPIFTKDAIVLGILIVLLSLIFITSKSDIPFFRKFYTYAPPLLLCYFLPALLNSFGVFSGKFPTFITLLPLISCRPVWCFLRFSIDLSGVRRLGSKAVIMFFPGTVGIVIHGPLPVLIVSTFAKHFPH